MSFRTWQCIGIIILITAYSGGELAAEETRPLPRRPLAPTGMGMGEFMLQWVDMAHEEISKRILHTVDRVDTFFADERIVEEKQRTQLTIITSAVFMEDEKPDITFPVDIDLTLPHLKNRFQLMIDSLLQEPGEQQEETEITEEGEGKQNELKVSVRYKVLEKALEWISLDGGVKMNPDTIGWKTMEPFGKIRIRATTDFDPWALTMTQQIFWFESEGFSATSRLDLERRLGRNSIFRLMGKAEYAPDIEGAVLKQRLLVRHKLLDSLAIGFELSGKGHTGPEAEVDECSAKLTYRARLYREWIFVSFEPEALFLSEKNFRMIPRMKIQLDIRFGDVS